jgi:hypothetical protein
MELGGWVRDRWTGLWVQVVAGAQPDGYVTVSFPRGAVVAVRTDHLEAI